MRRASDKVGSRRRDDDEIGLASEADVVERVAGTKNLGVDRTSRYSFECDGADELARAASHHDVDFSTGLCKQTRQPH